MSTLLHPRRSRHRARSRLSLRVRSDAHAGGRLSFGIVRCHQGDAGIVVEMRHLGVDEQRNPEIARDPGCQPASACDRAFQVVGQHHRPRRGGSAFERRDEGGLTRPGLAVPFVVDASHLLIAARHDSHFLCRRPALFDDVPDSPMPPAAKRSSGAPCSSSPTRPMRSADRQDRAHCARRFRAADPEVFVVESTTGPALRRNPVHAVGEHRSGRHTSPTMTARR